MKACMLPDYASQPCNGRVLERVGVHDVCVPMTGINDVVVSTKQSLYVELEGKNGAHMSRLVGLIEDNSYNHIEPTVHMMQYAIDNHNASKAFWEVSWEDAIMFNLEKLKPTFLVIPMSLEGALIKGSSPEWFFTFEFPYASVCPCSAEMTKSAGLGHPHMQRATATVTVQLDESQHVYRSLNSIKTLLNDIANAVGLIPVSLMKREDELKWCQLASEYNLFVEDAARRVGDAVDNFSSILDWVVVCEHEESIHQHNVVAVCRKGGRLS